MPPFTITTQDVRIHSDPAAFLLQFQEQSSLLFTDIFDPVLLEKLMARASASPFVDDLVENIGSREIEASQKIGAAISLLLGRVALLQWLEAATGLSPLCATMGRLVQTRANGLDALAWHDDMDQEHRKLGLVVNMSDVPFSGGEFEMRRKREVLPFRSVKHDKPGALMVFAVNPHTEHRVTHVSAGGPRRVYAGWATSRPEHVDHPLARPL